MVFAMFMYSVLVMVPVFTVSVAVVGVLTVVRVIVFGVLLFMLIVFWAIRDRNWGMVTLVLLMGT